MRLPGRQRRSDQCPVYRRGKPCRDTRDDRRLRKGRIGEDDQPRMARMVTDDDLEWSDSLGAIKRF